MNHSEEYKSAISMLLTEGSTGNGLVMVMKQQAPWMDLRLNLRVGSTVQIHTADIAGLLNADSHAVP
jgi:hypothetical protein